jgi:hypothetical protein
VKHNKDKTKFYLQLNYQKWKIWERKKIIKSSIVRVDKIKIKFSASFFGV